MVGLWYNLFRNFECGVVFMNYRIEKIDANNYSLFDDMVFWREHGNEREPSQY